MKKYLTKNETLFPKETHSKDGKTGKKWVTVRDVISQTPPLDAAKPDTAEFNEIKYYVILD